VSLTGQTAFVTGAGAPLGRAIVTAFANEGARILAFDDESAIDGIHHEAGRPRGAISLMPGKITSRSDVEAGVRRAIDLYGHLDIAVCNADLLGYRTFLELDDETWQAQLDVNLTGVFYSAQASARAMSQDRGGSVIVVTSVAAEIPVVTAVAYCAAKAAARMLAQGMAWELGASGVRVNTIAPGLAETGLVEPADLARVAVFLASPESSYITGAHLRVDAGVTIGAGGKAMEGQA
jgi:3-oxoacyl-[acyl-carrier protein] reductase